VKITRALSAIVAAGASVALLVGVAPSAEAVSWTKTGATKASAYSWNGYRATVGPVGFTLPRGYVKVANTITVKKGSATVAANRASVALSAGTYTVYSTFKYRSKTAYTAYKTVPVTLIDASTCAPAGQTLAAGSTWTIDTMTCTGVGYDSDYIDRTASFTINMLFAADANGYSEALQAGYSWDGWYLTSEWDTIRLGVFDASAATFVPYGDGQARVGYTAFKYGITKVAYRYRTQTVTKVVNTSVMTRTEWNTIMALRYWPTHSQVARIVGSSGSMRYTGWLGTAYRWSNTSGGYSILWFDADGTLSDTGNAWYSR
jgi:hypothetical protein